MKVDIKHRRRSGIYCIRNIINGKVYIGKAICVYNRIKQHITHLNTKNKDENPHLINSWHKHGMDNFEYFVVEFCQLDRISEREIFWIKHFNSLDRNHGYNLRLDSSTGLIISEETREKLRKSQIERFKDPKERKKGSHDFWKRNPEKLKRMAEKVAQLNVRYRIEQYDKKSRLLIKTWDSIIDLIKDNPDYKKHNIYAVCSGEKPSMYGYIWKKIMI
jgi:group I intron endonuclease